jgi:Cu/Ag efflux pump CusA
MGIAAKKEDAERARAERQGETQTGRGRRMSAVSDRVAPPPLLSLSLEGRMGRSFSMPSLIGLIMLMGIATKNSILLVEYAIEARRGKPAEGDRPAVPPMSRWDAMLDACHKRARPIVMTTIAMGAGMLPIAVGWGAADASFRSPMAIAVIGGLLTSTVLSLLVVPVVFTYLDDLGQWSGKMWRKLTQTRSKA